MEGAAEVVVSTVGVVVSTAAVAVFLAADITVEVGTAAIAAEGTAEGTAAATMAATKVVTPVVATGPTVAGAMEPMAGVATEPMEAAVGTAAWAAAPVMARDMGGVPLAATPGPSKAATVQPGQVSPPAGIHSATLLQRVRLDLAGPVACEVEQLNRPVPVRRALARAPLPLTGNGTL